MDILATTYYLILICAITLFRARRAFKDPFRFSLCHWKTPQDIKIIFVLRAVPPMHFPFLTSFGITTLGNARRRMVGFTSRLPQYRIPVTVRVIQFIVIHWKMFTHVWPINWVIKTHHSINSRSPSNQPEVLRDTQEKATVQISFPGELSKLTTVVPSLEVLLAFYSLYYQCQV